MIDHPLQKKLTTLSVEELESIYRQVFTTDAGKLVLEDLRNRANYFVPSFSDRGKQSDPFVCIFNEGSRAIVLTIESRINSEPKEIKQPEGPAGVS